MVIPGATAIRVLGTISGSSTTQTPANVHSLANVQNVYIVNSSPIPVTVIRNTALEGLPIYFYGHSYASVGGSNSYARYPGRLGYRLSTVEELRNVGGTSISQCLGSFLTTANVWTLGSTGLVVITILLVDAIFYGASAHDVEEFKEALRTILRLVRATEKREPNHASVVRSGWASTNSDTTKFSANTVHLTTSTSDTADITFTGNEITIVSRRNDTGIAAGTLEFVFPASGVGSTVIDELDCSDGFTAGLGAGTALYGVSKRLTGFGDGTHILRLRKKSGDSDPVYFDCWLNTNGTTPPLVLITKEANVNDLSGHTVPMDLFRQAVEDVALEPEFSWYTRTVDITGAGWDKNTMLGSDVLHLNDRGHALYADAITQKLYDVVTTFSGGVNALL